MPPRRDVVAIESPTDPNWAGRSRLADLQEPVVKAFLFSCALLTIVTTAGIVIVLGIEAARFFRQEGVTGAGFFLGTSTDPDGTPPTFGLLPLLWGTLVIAVGSSAIALPIGLLSAIYLSEYAPKRLRDVLKPTLELLAGVPTIVYGYLAILVVTPLLKAMLNPVGLRVETFNALSACVVVGIMVIPMVSSLSEDVLSAVPRGLREAAYGLGATKFEVSTRIVLPAALSGVAASFILAISRAVGETMAVVLAAGADPKLTLNPLKSIETMTAYMVAVSGADVAGTTKTLSVFAVGLSLFAITLLLNLASGLVLRRFREVYE